MKKFISLILCVLILVPNIMGAYAADLIDADKAAEKAAKNISSGMISEASSEPFSLNSQFAIAIDMNDSTVLYSKKPDVKIQIASMTKIMTAVVALENIKDLDEKFVLSGDLIKEVTPDESVAGLWIGETVSYRDLLYGLMLPSGADAAYALVNKTAGSSKKFVEMMNDKAQQLGLKNTHFSNVVGLDGSQNYSTVSDIAKLFSYALKNKDFYEIDTSMKYTTSTGSHTFTSTIYDHQKSMGTNLEYLLGGKTGTTSGAGLCLASIAKQGDAYIMLVTADAEVGSIPYNVKDARTVYEYYFDNYSYRTIKTAGSVLYKIPTYLCKNETYDVITQTDIVKYLPNTFDESKVTVKYTGKNQVTYKMKSGTDLGTVSILYDGKEVSQIPVKLSSDMHFSLGAWIKLHPFYFTLILLGVLLLIAAAALLILLALTDNLHLPKKKATVKPAKNKTVRKEVKEKNTDFLPKIKLKKSDKRERTIRTTPLPQKKSRHSSSSIDYEELKRQKEQEKRDWYDF